MKKIVLALSIAIMVIACFSGCVKQESVSVPREGTLQLKITDKPGDLDIIYANVTISTIQVHIAEAEQESETEEEVEEETAGGDFNVSTNGPYNGSINVDIQFLGTASDGEEPYNWSWDFGDGNTSIEQNPMHNYSANGTYTINLTVTDNTSSTGWAESTVTIGEIEDNDDTDDTSESGWITVIDESKTFDLIKLINVTDVIGEKNLTAGRYTQIRLTVESADITINNSGEIENHKLKIPSNKIKLVKSFMIYKNETTVLTLDFDVYESIHQAGNKFIMKPTIKVIQE